MDSIRIQGFQGPSSIWYSFKVGRQFTSSTRGYREREGAATVPPDFRHPPPSPPFAPLSLSRDLRLRLAPVGGGLAFHSLPLVNIDPAILLLLSPGFVHAYGRTRVHRRNWCSRDRFEFIVCWRCTSATFSPGLPGTTLNIICTCISPSETTCAGTMQPGKCSLNVPQECE